jgi:hypothetical protein
MQSLAISRAITLLVLLLAGGARAQDAAQSLDSPLGTGTGLTFSASRDKTALRFGFTRQVIAKDEQQIPRHTGFSWSLALEGAVSDTGSKALLVSPGGDFISPGLTLKLDLGYSSAMAQRTEAYEQACGEFIELLEEREKAKAQASCVREVGRLAKLMAPQVDVSEAKQCSEALTALSQAVSEAELEKLRPSVRARYLELLDEGMEDTSGQVNAAIARVRKALEPPANGGPKKKRFASCEELRSEDPEAYDRIIGPHRLPDYRYRFAINGIAETRSARYVPVGEGGPDLATTESWLGELFGAALEARMTYKGRMVLGAQAGYRQTLELTSIEVCRTSVQGSYSSRSCRQAVLGEPKPQDALFLTVGLLFSPLGASWPSGLEPGVEFLGRFQTTEGPGRSFFERGSNSLRLSLPIFVSNREDPWGLRAGVAPEYSLVLGDASQSVFSVSLFVGAGPLLK